MTRYANNPIESSLTSGDREAEALFELESSPLGRAVLEALRKAEDVHLARGRYLGSKMFGRGSTRPQSAEERLAEWLLDQVGGADSPYRLCEISADALERQREYDKARMP